MGKGGKSQLLMGKDQKIWGNPLKMEINVQIIELNGLFLRGTIMEKWWFHWDYSWLFYWDSEYLMRLTVGVRLKHGWEIPPTA